MTERQTPSRNAPRIDSGARRGPNDWGEGVCRNRLCGAKFVRKRKWQKYCSLLCKQEWERMIRDFFIGEERL